MLTPEQAKQVDIAERSENYSTCITGKYPTLCKHHLLTPEQAKQVDIAERGGLISDPDEAEPVQPSNELEECSDSMEIWDNCIAEYEFPSGLAYKGEWKNNQPHGRGKMTNPDGLVYEGMFLDGKPSGDGKLLYPSGEEKLVHWKGDVMFVDGEMVPSETIEAHTSNNKDTQSMHEQFNLEQFGSFVHFPKLPNTLFLIYEIGDGDAFQFKRALRKNDIDLIVLSTPGGLVSEGLLIADSIHDLGLNTYIPERGITDEGNCASACAFIFFSGHERKVDGQLGVHQFYSLKEKQTSSAEVEQETQFTVSEIIGFLNKYQTPPWVFERMFEQKEMYYFTEEEKALLETEFSDKQAQRAKEAQAFLDELNQFKTQN